MKDLSFSFVRLLLPFPSYKLPNGLSQQCAPFIVSQPCSIWMCLDGIFPFLLLPISLVVSWATIIRVDPKTEQATHLDNDRFQMMIPVDENEKLYLEKPKSLWFIASYLFLFSLGNAKGRGTRKEVEEEEHVERRRESIGLNNESFGMHEASEPIRLLLTRYNSYYPTCHLCTCRFFFPFSQRERTIICASSRPHTMTLTPRPPFKT